MKFIVFLAFLALANGAPRPSDDDHVVNKPIGHDDVHIPDEPEREDIVSHEGKDGHGILHTTQKPLLGHDGHGIRHTTSVPDGPKDESLFGRTIVPPFVDPELSLGKRRGVIRQTPFNLREYSE